MKLRSIHLENYRSHADTTLDLDKLTAVRGPNHSGKSSIEQAIETCLTRRNQTTGANGQGLVDSIRFGEDKAVIELLFDHGEDRDIELRASITSKSGLSVTLRKQKDKEWNPTALANALQRDRDVLSCLCNSRWFVSQDEKKQKALLASIVMPTTMITPEETLADLNAQGLQSWHPDHEGQVFQYIELIYKRAFDQRTEINRLLKEWHTPDTGEAYAGPDVAEIRARVNQRQDERTTLALKKQSLQRDIDEARRRKSDFEQRAAEADSRAAREKVSREEIAKGVLSKGALKKAEEEAKGLAEAQELDARIQKRSGELERLNERLTKITNLDSFGPQCPTCMQVITEEVIDKIIAPFKEEFDQVSLDQTNDFDKRKTLGDPAGAQKRIDAHKTVEADLKRIDSRIADLERQAQVNRDEAAKINPDSLPQPETVDAELLDLDARILKGTTALTMAAAATERQRAHTAALKRKTELGEEQARLERLVAFFGPSGIKAKLIQEHIGPFENRINAVLAKWGYQCALQIEPEYGFVVKPTGGDYPCQLHQLSQSEQYRFSAAFSCALAVVSGWKFVICDGADILDNRSALNGALLSNELDQGIVLATDLSDAIPAKPMPGVTFIKLTDSVVNGVRTTRAEALESAMVAA